ncbi:unnamed protein product [Lactuca saligna]|uniref:Uncharacterized protein n=1 Tax=Lactuca saligna TaxID=75948 RepID=A0AA35V8K4_LACSI|nr:unnamed protein product [Lactuca saligna]
MGVLQTQTTLVQSTPLFTDSTATTTTTTNEPPLSVNSSDAGAGGLGFSVGHSTPPISPLRQDDPDMIFSEDEEDFRGFTYSPFNIQTENDDDAPVTKGQLKAINEKVDSLIQSSKTQTNDEYS